MRIDKLKKLLTEIIADPGNTQKLARLCRTIGDEMPRDDFRKLAEVRRILASARETLAHRASAGPANDLTHAKAACAALCDTLVSYEVSARSRCCALCEDRLLEYIEVAAAVPVDEHTAERHTYKVCRPCETHAIIKGARYVRTGSFRKPS